MKLEEQLYDVKRVAIAGHVKPDGDCVGSTLAVYNYIRKYHPEMEVELHLEPIPNIFKFLANADKIDSSYIEKEPYDLFIALDCGDEKRLGNAVKYFHAAKRTFCVDHHISNQNFADANYIFPEASSTCELVYELIDEEKITKEIAECIYVGIVHDTGVFQYSCTSAKTMNIAGRLMEMGIDFSRIVDKTYYEKTYEQNRILGQALVDSQLFLDGKCIASIVTKEEMEKYGRRYNSCGYMYTDNNSIDHFYEDQTDNYVQKNYQLLFNHNFTSAWNVNAGLHYTKGDGYYQEYKDGRELVEYGLLPYEHDGETVNESDLIRKKAMDNRFGGGIFSVNYKGDRLHASLGGGLNRYDGDHFGKVLWVKNYIGNLDPDKDYYRNNATKNDGNLYLKADYELCNGLNVYADLQYRHISYKMYGQNDKWNSVTNDGLQQLAIHEKFDFFNPKAGLSWQLNRNNRIYGSFSVAHKEPTRNNYTDGKFTEHPKAERLFDYELGYTFADSWLTFGANLYYMDYKDQLVLTGELNEIGEAVAANVPDSYRMGIELMAGLKLPCGFQWDINATLSRNRVENFTETLYENEDPAGEKWSTYLGDTHIAFSPDFLLNNRFGYTYKGFEAALQSQYVSKQYMSNLDCKDHILDAYFVSNLNLSYTFTLPKIKSVTIGCTVYNLFNEEYENNGYAGSGFYYEDGQKVRYNYAGYAAQAGTNVLGHISLRF